MYMKNIVNFVKKFIVRTSLCFSGIVLLVAVTGIIMQSDKSMSYISVEQMLTFLWFSLLFALCFGICDFIKNSTVIRRSVQFVLTMASVVFVFILGKTFSNYVDANSVQNPAFSVIAILFVAAIIYAVIGLCYLALKAIGDRALCEKQEYTRVYVKDKNDE